MKTRSLLVASMLAMFISTTSTPSVFAQKFKYKPLPKGKKAVTVPHVVNPRLSRAAQESITRWSGVEMVRPNAAGGVARHVSASTVTPSRLQSAVARTVAARVSQAAPLITTDFLNGAEALAAFRPGWRSELMLSGFTRQQLDLVEQTFKETDQFLFETDEAGHWLSPRSAEWNYTDRYAQILTDNAWGEMALNDGQIKTLFGKFSRLDDVFTRLNLQSFMLTHEGRAPKPNAPGKEGELARHVRYNINKRHPGMNPEVEEYVYGKMPAKLKTPKPSYGPKGRAPRRTPDEVYEEVVQFIKDNCRFPSRSAERPVERSLRVAFDKACKKAEEQNLKDGTSMRLLALKAEHVNDIAAFRTPDEVYDDVVQFIKDNGRFPSRSAEAPVERSLRWAFVTACRKAEAQNLKDGTSMRLLALKAEHVNDRAAPRTPQEILEQVKAYRAAHNGQNPSQSSTDHEVKSLRQAWNNFHQKYKDVPLEEMEDEVARELEKLYRETVGGRN